MPDFRDPFDALRRPVVPLAPRAEFAALLRRRLEEELGMAITEETTAGVAPVDDHGSLAMVHLRVGDADRSMRFFSDLFGWRTERVVYAGHVNHYTLNTTVGIRLVGDPDAPPVVPNYAVRDVAPTVRRIEDAGGRILESDVTPDGGGWARAEDDQGLPLIVYRKGGYEHYGSTSRASGDVGLVFLRADAGTAERFYGRVLGWRFERAHPGSFYFHAVPHVGLFDEAALRGQDIPPSVTLYLDVDALSPALARIEELGGKAGSPAHDMGPYFSAMCSDDQGTAFGLMATTLE